MPALLESQRRFGAALTGASPNPDFYAAFCETPEVAERRFAAYRRNVRGNWIAALESCYPVLCQLLGTEAFRHLAADFIAHHPSQEGDLNRYGAPLADYLEHTPIAADLPYLADMARLEFALQRAYFSSDPAAFDLAALAALPATQQGNIRLQLWPGAQLLNSRAPIADIWLAHQHAEASERDAALERIDLTPAPRHLLATRAPSGEPAVHTLSQGEARFLAACRDGHPLTEAITQAQALEPSVDAGLYLRAWITRHLITGFEPPSQENP